MCFRSPIPVYIRSFTGCGPNPFVVYWPLYYRPVLHTFFNKTFRRMSMSLYIYKFWLILDKIKILVRFYDKKLKIFLRLFFVSSSSLHFFSESSPFIYFFFISINNDLYINIKMHLIITISPLIYCFWFFFFPPKHFGNIKSH